LFVVSRDVVYRVCYLGAGGEGQCEDLREKREKGKSERWKGKDAKSHRDKGEQKC
jgi:hypothetical protein